MGKILIILKFFLLFSFLILQGCFVYGDKKFLTLNRTIKEKMVLDATVRSIKVESDKLIINGSGFDKVSVVKIKDDHSLEDLKISSVSNTQIIVTAKNAFSFILNHTFELVIATAEAQTSFPLTFTLQDGAVTASKLSSMGASNGQILKYNGTNWAPSNLPSSQVYMGVWDATTNSTPYGINAGEFYIVSVAGFYNGVGFLPGDWIIFNGSNWDKVENSSYVVSSFNGRQGVVTLQPEDYVSLKDSTTHKITGSKLADIADVSVAGVSDGKILKWNATDSTWKIADDNVVSEGAVGAAEIANGVISNSHISAGANIDVSKLGTGAINNITFNYLSGVSSSIQTQLNGKEGNLATGTSGQYYRGDKTWQNLTSTAVSEGTNLYYTDARVILAPLSGFLSTNSSIVATDSILAGFGKAQGQINAHATSLASKADTTNTAQTITALALTGLSSPVSNYDAVNKIYVDGLVNGNGVWTKSGSDIYFNSGKVGIGATNPGSPLTVVGSSTGTLLSVKDSNNTNFSMTTDAQGRATISANGSNVGAGGAYFNAVGYQEAWFGVFANSNTSGQRNMRFGNGQPANTFSIQLLNDAGTGITSTPFSIVNSAPTGSFYMNGSGNIGIGTTSPAGILDVRGGTAASNVNGTPINIYSQIGGGASTTGGAINLIAGHGSVNTTGTVGGSINITAGNESGGSSNNGHGGNVNITSGAGNGSGGNIILNAPGTGAGAGYGGSGVIRFDVNNASRMIIKSDGNVGIATSTPSQALSVAGNILAISTSNYIGVADNTHGAILNRKLSIDDGTYVNTVFSGVASNAFGFKSINGYNFEVGSSGTGLDVMTIKNSGNVGIGTISPSYTLHVNGSVAGTSAYNNLSDSRFKKDIEVIPNSIEKLLKLDGVFYNWRIREFPDRKFSNRREMGVIAQNVEKVFPEAVSKDKNGFRSVAYSMLIAPLINAVKELYNKFLGQGAILSQHTRQITTIETNKADKEEIRKLKEENAEIKLRLEKLEKKLKK